jgi:trimethylamine--corrinoid protein Co-methyltransferase
MDEEISAMSRRIAAGIRVNEETIAADVIKEIGPRGDYLTADHTLRWLHSDEYITPRVSVRGPRASWEAKGSPDTYALARDRVRSYASSAGSPIDAERAAKLSEIIASFGTEVAWTSHPH